MLDIHYVTFCKTIMVQELSPTTSYLINQYTLYLISCHISYTATRHIHNISYNRLQSQLQSSCKAEMIRWPDYWTGRRGTDDRWLTGGLPETMVMCVDQHLQCNSFPELHLN